MEPLKDIEPTADAVRIAIADAIADAAMFSAEQELPRSEETLSRLEAALRQNRFTVLVCGEAKRGKSTFINALIGRPLLPTDVDIATSQVFQIRSGEPESFLVRYEDESGQYIAAEDLSIHGSQVIQDTLKNSETVTSPALTVRQIEVIVPAAHLPQEITLLDTPGLGSLYSGHARITYRFMPTADAVIFVLDSQAPITQPELAFLAEIVPVTRHIFFVQTRIDQFQQSDWQEVYERNSALLRETFGETLAQHGNELSVWPVSSKNLLLASRMGSSELFRVSRFPVMLTALRRFLFQVTGVARARHVLAQMTALYHELRPVLEARVAVATGETLLDWDPAARGAVLRDEWGPDSPWQLELEIQLGDIRERYLKSFREALQPGGEIETLLQSQIDDLINIAYAERLARSLANEAVERANLLWRQTMEQATNAVSEKIAPLCGQLRGDSALMEGLIERTLDVTDVSAAEQTTRVKDTWANRARLLWRESGVLTGAGSTMGRLLPGVGNLLTSWLRPGNSLVEQVKPELQEYLQTVMEEIRSLYGAPAQEISDPTGRVEVFFSELDAAARYAVKREYERKTADFMRESERLRILSADTEAVGAQQEVLAQWDAWNERLELLDTLLDHVATLSPAPLAPPPVPEASSAIVAARESIQARARIAAQNGDIGEQEKQKLIAEAQKRGLSLEEAMAIVESVFVSVFASAEESSPTVIEAATEAPRDSSVAFRMALVTAIRESGDDDAISDTWEEHLDELAETAGLTRSMVRRMEREVREELAAAERSVVESEDQTPEAQYATRFRVTLIQAGGADAELSDVVLDELDSFAVALSLTRSEVRRIERETRHDLDVLGQKERE